MNHMIWYFYVLAAVAAAALLAGFCMGRITKPEEAEEEEKNDKTEKIRKPERSGKNEKKIQTAGGRESEKSAAGGTSGECWFVGSPVTGDISALREGDRPSVVITPAEDRLYAPANGKITRLFPLGNAFLFSTEFGTELLIQAGEVRDELLGRYYRPRILQNEIVGKGRVILEFDRQGLEAEGVAPEVSVSVETHAYDSRVLSVEGERVRTGEEILQVRNLDS